MTLPQIKPKLPGLGGKPGFGLDLSKVRKEEENGQDSQRELIE
jgi:hypothetical protein